MKLNLFTSDKLRDVGRVYHEIGASFAGEGAALPSEAQYLATSEDAGVPVAVLKTIWQIETRQVALLYGRPLIRIEPLKWKRFGGDPRDLPKPLNPGGDTPASTITGQKIRWENYQRLRDIDPIRTIAVTSHGGSQTMGFNGELCGCKDERTFEQAMAMGPAMQLVLMSRMIRHPKNAAMRIAMQKRDVDAISHHWNGPAFRKWGYQLKVAAGLRKFA